MRGGQSFVDGSLAATWRPRDGATGAAGILARVGITVSSKVGVAVVRNRVKRKLREAVRHEIHGLPAIDLVLTARPSAAFARVDEFRAFLRLVGKRMGGAAR